LPKLHGVAQGTAKATRANVQRWRAGDAGFMVAVARGRELRQALRPSGGQERSTDAVAPPPSPNVAKPATNDARRNSKASAGGSNIATSSAPEGRLAAA
jgi:hypothetical protein